MNQFIEEALAAIAQLAIQVLGKDRTIEILQAEYNAADVAADEAQKIAFPKP